MSRITKEELELVAYKEMQAKFEELGVPEVWKPGKKKETMILEAIEKLNLIKSLENAGLEKDDIEKAVSKVKDNKEELAKAEALKEAQEKEALEKAQTEKAVELKLTLPQIEKNLKNIEANLKNNIPSQRVLLLNKKAMLMKMIDDKNYQD